jgi:O-antigen/teichoic acid export membrane protein
MSDTKRLLGNSSIVFIGTIVSSIFSYLFNTLMGRMLGPSGYGDLTAILSLVSVTSVFGAAVLMVTTQYVAQAKSAYAVHRLFRKETAGLLLAGSILFLLSLVLAAPIAALFSISNVLAAAIASASVFFTIVIMVNRGVLQGLQRFPILTVTNILEMVVRLGIGLFLVRIGWSVAGSVTGVVAGTMVAYIVSYVVVVRILQKNMRVSDDLAEKNNAIDDSKDQVSRKELFTYAFPTLVAMFMLTLSLALDVILVKYLFSAETAGLYAAVSTVAKIIAFMVAPVVSVMFPMIAEKRTKGERHYQTFLLSLGLTLVGALILLTMYTIAPGTILGLLYGSAFRDLYYLLPQVGLYIVFYALINLISNYFLAVRDYLFLYGFGAYLLVVSMLVMFGNYSLEMVVRIFVAASGIFFAILMARYLYTKRVQLVQLLSNSQA